MIELNDEYRAVAKDFRKKFGYGVPLSMIPPVTETPDLIRNLKECIVSGKDDLLERYNVAVGDGDFI